MFSTKFCTLLLLTTTITASLLFNQGEASFIPNELVPSNTTGGDAAKDGFGELNDLNKKSSSSTENNQSENIANSMDSSSLKHHDEDMPRLQDNNLELEESLNYDVEILESGDIKKENIEIEERFRGNAIQVDTDTFFAENIEVHGGEDIQQSHMILTIILLIIALVSIALYAVLVIWRSHLEQRYGMRELLVNDDDDYCQQQNNTSRNAAGHFSIVQL